MRLQPMIFEPRQLFDGWGWFQAPMQPQVTQDRSGQSHRVREPSTPQQTYPDHFWEPVSSEEAAKLKQDEAASKDARVRFIPIKIERDSACSSDVEELAQLSSSDDQLGNRTFQNRSNNGLPDRNSRRRSKVNNPQIIDLEKKEILIESDDDLEHISVERLPQKSSQRKENHRKFPLSYKKKDNGQCELCDSDKIDISEEEENERNEIKEWSVPQHLSKKSDPLTENCKTSTFCSKEEELQYRDLVEFFSCDSNDSKSEESVLACKNNIVDTPSYPAYGIIQKIIERDGRQVDYIKGDGNCFFRALSKVIYGSESCHEELRQAVVDLMEKYPRKFEQFIDSGFVHDHIISMRKSGTWATQAEIYVAATLLQRDVYVLSPDHTGECYRWLLFSPRFSYPDVDVYDSCHITLCHTNGNHYDRIAPLQGDCNCKLKPPQLLGVSAEVDLTDEIV